MQQAELLQEIEEDELRANMDQQGLPKESLHEDGDANTFYNPDDGPAEGENAGSEADSRPKKRARVN